MKERSIRNKVQRIACLAGSIAVFAMLSFASRTATAQQEPDQLESQVDALVKPHWNEINRWVGEPSPRGHRFWNYRISVPFPAVWPPDGSGKVRYYAYARASAAPLVQSRPLGQFKPSTSFARSVPPSPSPSPEPYTSAPWAQVTVSVDGSTAPTLELLDKTIRDISGPRDDELVVFDNEVDKPGSRSAGCKWLLEYAKNKTLPDTDIGQLRMYYCRWIDANAAIAQEIRSSHVAFFKWLNCMGW